MSDHKEIIADALKIARKAEIRVFCSECQGGNNTIWKGSLIDWGIIMSQDAKKDADIPQWAQYAWRHQQAHGHTIMVQYPSQCVPMFDPLRLKTYE